MSFPISRGTPTGAALDPSVQTDAAGSSSARSEWEQRAQSLPLQQALYYTSDVPLRTFLGSDQAVTVRRELDAALQRLEDVLAPLDRFRSLSDALTQLKHSLDRDEDRHAQMLGHGKRWLTGLLRLLETHPSVDVTDRRRVCELLVDGFHAQVCPPATVFGLALNVLRDRLPGGADARVFRELLQQRVLVAMLEQWPSEAGTRKISPQQRARALMAGFGVVIDPLASKSTGAAAPVDQLNRAATFVEERLHNQVYAVAHDLMGRLEGCYQGAARAPLPRAEGLSTAEDAAVRSALDTVRTIMDVNLLPYLFTRDAAGRGIWHLQTSGHLAECIRAALPELAPPLMPSPAAAMPAPATLASAALSRTPPASDDELVLLSSPSDASTSTSSLSSSLSSEASPALQPRQSEHGSGLQESGSGATGTFKAGTGGASNRGPT